MLNSNILQNNISSLQAVATEAEKLKKEGAKNQEATQKKIDEMLSQRIRSVNATDQDSDAQKILDEEEKEKKQNFNNKRNTSAHVTEIMKDPNKGTIVDIKC